MVKIKQKNKTNKTNKTKKSDKKIEEKVKQFINK